MRMEYIFHGLAFAFISTLLLIGYAYVFESLFDLDRVPILTWIATGLGMYIGYVMGRTDFIRK